MKKKSKEKRGRNKQPVWLEFAETVSLVLLIVGIMALVAAVFDGPVMSNHPSGKVIYDYQTLIAAIMAVVASFITISKMRAIDVDQSDRHRQLIALNLRPSLLKLQRLEVVWKKDFVGHFEEVKQEFQVWEDGLPNGDYFGDNYRALRNAIFSIPEGNVVGISSAEELFDAQVFDGFRKFDEVRDKLRQTMFQIDWVIQQHHYSVDQMIKSAEPSHNKAADEVKQLGAIIDEITINISDLISRHEEATLF